MTPGADLAPCAGKEQGASPARADVGCRNCAADAVGPSWVYSAGCRRCQARAIARGPDFHRCLTARSEDDAYRALIDAAGVEHDEVKAAYRLDRSRRNA